MSQCLESWGRYPKATPAKVTRLTDRNAPLPQSDLPMLVFGIFLVVALFFAMLPLMLGLLLFMPVFSGAVYASYRDIFTEV